jgi:hypothetical protein
VVKRITAREIFSRVPTVKEQLWGGEFWTDGYFVSTVGAHANEDVIRHYIKNQGEHGKYKQLHKQELTYPVIWKAQVVQGVTVSVTPPWYNGLNK